MATNDQINRGLRVAAGRPGAKPEQAKASPDPEDVLERVEEALDVLTASADSLRELRDDLAKALDGDDQDEGGQRG